MPGPDLPIAIYHKFFSKCLHSRIPVDQFESYLNQLLARSPIPPHAICSTILSPALTLNNPDPLHLQYVSRIVERDVVTLANVLSALLKTSTAKLSPASTLPEGSFQDGGEELRGRESLEQDVFLVLANILRIQKPRTSESVWSAVQAMSEWMEALCSGMDGADRIAEVVMAADIPTRCRLEALGEMVIALGMNEGAIGILAQDLRREKKLRFQSSLSLFIPYIQIQNPPLSSRLEELRQQHLVPHNARGVMKGGPAGEAMNGMIMGLGGDVRPVVWTRAHLYVWLNGLICGRPRVDDDTILGYLHNRYKDDENKMIPDFIVAVIDVISSAIDRDEPPSTLFLLRSFLTNKVPLLLSQLSTSPLTSSYAISQAFLRSDVSTLMTLPPARFEPYSYSPDMFNDITVDLRQDFLFACALHSIIGEQDIQGILGELPLGAMPDSGKYDTQQILNLCATDPNRVERLLEETEGVDGNAGAVVRALFKVMKRMCESRETLPLRNICSFLARKPSSIDVMLLFIKPGEVLEPLCDLLDTWRYEEDQGEYQPVYEEFGYILLLVLTIIYRYSFTALDLTHTHAPNNEAFIPQLLHQFTAAQRIETISSSDQHAQLGGWIKELFENEGISDGPMMACRPQEFYKLVPTIFSQSLLALERGVVDIGAVKDAFAFLLTPFLLPSVVSGLSWLSQHLWSHLDAPHNDLQILASLIIAPGLAPETAETHRTVISIAARPLDAVLRDLLSRPDAAPDARVTAQELLTHIKPHLNFKRSGYPTREEMDNWMHSAGSGGLTTTLVNSFNNLLAWSNNTASRSATYTHSLLLASWKLLGARRVVEALIAEAVKNRVSNTTVAGMAEDLVVSFVCACVIHEDCGGRLKLIDALKALEEDHTANKSIIFYDSCDEDIKGEITLSVLRRVEAQIIPYPSIQHHHDHDRQHDVEMNSVSMGMVNMGGVDAVIGQSIADDGMGDLMMGGDFVTGMLDENTHMNI